MVINNDILKYYRHTPGRAPLNRDLLKDFINNIVNHWKELDESELEMLTLLDFVPDMQDSALFPLSSTVFS